MGGSSPPPAASKTIRDPQRPPAPPRRGGCPSKDFGPERNAREAKDATDLHVANFIECVRSRKTPNADIEIGHRSTIVPHIGNIAYKTERKLVWDAAKEDFVNDAAASKMLGRKARKPWDLI